MHLSTPNTPNRNMHIYQNSTKTIEFFFFFFFFLKKISGGPTYSEQKVVYKRLGNFVAIFIYLKKTNFSKKTLCGNWPIVQKIGKISALNHFVNITGGRGRRQWRVIAYITSLHFFKFLFLCRSWTCCIPLF